MNQEKMPSDQSSELPPPVERQASYVNERESAKKVEQGTVGSSMSAAPQSNDSGSQAVQGTPPSSQQPAQQQATRQVVTPHIADDEDLIEKEWIESAKRIVAQTKGDPHAQSEGIGAIKNDYKKKRFNIDNNVSQGE
ncbi:MAG: hypothetical protein U5L95_01525 [Candidatus Saccharibacteria bacterium]|nr:hypothetical protein [Candidatus Saccharibacteria bacterium]